MNTWTELTARDKPSGLDSAVRRQVGPGRVRYTFIHDELEVDDPALDVTGRFFVSPKEYGFVIRGYEGGRTAWARDFANGSMLVVNRDATSHVLSPRVASRIVFIGAQGASLQDTGLEGATNQPPADLVSVRLTINATFDLHGESPEAARAVLTRMLDQALSSNSTLPGSRAQLLRHTYESSSLVSEDTRSSHETDFSKLLDI